MPEQVYPNITVVNDDDEVIGAMQLFDAIAQGLRRRASVIFLINYNDEVLLQRRSAQVLSPNKLDFSVGGHVNEGSDYLNTAKDELWEELRLKDIDLTMVIPPIKTAGFYTAVYKAILPNDIVIQPNTEEVSEAFWLSFEELRARIESTPEDFTATIQQMWPFVHDKILP